MTPPEDNCCRVHRCYKDSVTPGGPPYGLLCAEHLAEAKQRLSARLSEGKRNAGAAASKPTADGDGFAAQLREAAKIGRRLDVAARRLAAVGAPEKVKAEFEEAVRRANAVPAPENLERLEAASRAMRKGAAKRAAAVGAHAKVKQDLKQALTVVVRDLTT